METNRPLILVTNDDGIGSPGLRAAAHAVLPLGELLVAAPKRQWSGAGRSMPPEREGQIDPVPFQIDGQPVTAYAVAASPAVVVLHALLELAPRRPALAVSGINFGENPGTDVTVSGTVGAALQAASHGIPALAASLQTPKETHARFSDDVDFSAAAHFVRLLARAALAGPLPPDVDVLKIDVPAGATPATPWRVTRASRHTYFISLPSGRTDLSTPLSLDYTTIAHPERCEPDSDIYALAVDHVVSVTPLSLDLTSRTDMAALGTQLDGATHRRDAEGAE